VIFLGGVIVGGGVNSFCGRNSGLADIDGIAKALKSAPVVRRVIARGARHVSLRPVSPSLDQPAG